MCIDRQKEIRMNLISETEETELVRLALEARKLAYAPYSG